MRTSTESLSTTLFGKARREVLLILYGNTDRAFYVRQLARLTGLGMGALQRELDALSQAGIIERTTQGRHIFFKADDKCPIFQELKSIVAKTIARTNKHGSREESMNSMIRTVLTELQQEFQTLYGERLTKLFLFGSQARGDAEDGSDIDVLVVLKGHVYPSVEVDRTADITARLSLKYDTVISCVFVSAERYSKERSPLLINVRREGVAL